MGTTLADLIRTHCKRCPKCDETSSVPTKGTGVYRCLKCGHEFKEN
jgi:ribosomal protein L37AE/L43A